MAADRKMWKEVEGLKVPYVFPTESIQSALKYEPRDGDTFLVTYPKCGTHWMINIIYLLRNNGEPCASFKDFLKISPLLEVEGASWAENMERPGLISTHFPYGYVPFSSNAKYIVVIRNPKDVVVSLYHHLLSIDDKVEFDKLFEQFIEGDVAYGDFFKYVLDWYKHRNDPNILLISYEELKMKTRETISKIAAFLDPQLGEKSDLIDKVIKYSSVEETRKVVQLDKVINIADEDPSSVPPFMLKVIQARKESSPGSDERRPKGTQFVRKGIVGDWKNFLSDEQSQRLNEKSKQNLKETTFYALWKDIGIFD